MLRNAANAAAGVLLLEFLKGPEARMTLIQYGYLIPEN